jgi:hypothetical protein
MYESTYTLFQLPYAPLAERDDALRPEIQIEMSSWPMRRPSVDRTVTSFVAEAYKRASAIARFRWPCALSIAPIPMGDASVVAAWNHPAMGAELLVTGRQILARLAIEIAEGGRQAVASVLERRPAQRPGRPKRLKVVTLYSIYAFACRPSCFCI